ncbi:DUF3006 domain-containing protein [Parafannyhessea umbonata]|uniref:DUF3006 domain-containing protein n=1 Tax=Parafannyhessea umbonata TaxID=604330 RepID=UPI00359C3ECD
MRAIVDRLEGDVAVLEVDGYRYVDAPLAELPPGVREGDVLDGEPGSWVLNEDEKSRRLAQNANLMSRLFRR